MDTGTEHVTELTSLTTVAFRLWCKTKVLQNHTQILMHTQKLRLVLL
jgi:hypothetical protein